MRREQKSEGERERDMGKDGERDCMMKGSM
jgi:hypothetical protein